MAYLPEYLAGTQRLGCPWAVDQVAEAFALPFENLGGYLLRIVLRSELALAIAQRLGIAELQEQVITGKDLTAFDEESLNAVVRQKTVYARVNPAWPLTGRSRVESSTKPVENPTPDSTDSRIAKNLWRKCTRVIPRRRNRRP